MKAIRAFSIWKAIAFLILSISFSACDCENNDLKLKPVVTIQPAENVTTSSVVVALAVVPNQDNVTVLVEYKESNSDWKTIPYTSKLSGNKSIKVTLDITDLKPGTLYSLRATAIGSFSSSEPVVGSFTTAGLPQPIIKLSAISEIKINTAKMIAWVTPRQDNVPVSLDYRTKNSTWKNQIYQTSLSGNDSIKVTFDLLDLQANTEYEFRFKAGEVISSSAFFTTYAVSDFDGNLYHTVTIGTQTWLKENFKGTHYANGDAIAYITNKTDWANQKTGAYCYYNNDPENGKVYGALYNYWVGIDPRGLIKGWHVPTFYEFVALNNYLDTSNNVLAGVMMSEASDLYWNETGRKRTNASGFTALPNGHINLDQSNNFTFDEIKDVAVFWGKDDGGDSANYGIITKEQCIFFYSAYCEKRNGFAIRLIK